MYFHREIEINLKSSIRITVSSDVLKPKIYVDFLFKLTNTFENCFAAINIRDYNVLANPAKITRTQIKFCLQYFSTQENMVCIL